MLKRFVPLFLVALFVMPQFAGAQELCGRWHGCWVDHNSGHQGRLNARFDYHAACDQYHVVFTGTFFKVVPFRFATTLNVTGRDGDKVFLSGTSNVPLFGAFSYNAVATACDFTADFCSKRWTGRFTLSR
jgi:hypothetical protein